MGEITVRNIKKIIAAAMISVFAISAVGCNMIEKTPEAIAKTTVAKVGSKKITRGEVDSHPYMTSNIEQFKQQYGENYAESEQVKASLKQIRLQVVNELTGVEAMLQEAERLKVVPTEEELNKEVDKSIGEFKTSQGIKDDAAYTDLLKLQGYTVESFREALKDSAIIGKLQEKLLKDVKVEDKKIQEEYNKHKDKYPKDANDPTVLNLSHIIVKDEAQAQSIKDQLDKGADFAELAKKFGTDGTKETGGVLGDIPTVNHSYDQNFMDAAMQLKEGEVSEVVKSQYGYHLIKVNKRTDKPLKTFEEAKEEIKESLLNAKKNEVWNQKYTEINENAKIKIYEEELE